MIIIWGTRLFGKVDEVPGLFHVATKCGHIYYLPLIPAGSVLVFSKSGDSYLGKPVGFSFKSWAIAWLRVGLGIGAAAMIGLGMMLLNDRRPMVLGGVCSIIGGLAAIGMLVATYYVTGIGKASYARAVALAEKAELTEEALVRIEQHFGRISEEDARKALAELEAAGREMERLQRAGPGSGGSEGGSSPG